MTGTFANPNLLAAFLVLLLPLAAVGSSALAERASRMLGTGVVVCGYAAVPAWPPPAGAGRARGPHHADPGRGAVEGRCRL
ncbi:hypothetical protein K1T35_18575 [Pseudonocardia sp. DSM 110487]|uniref:hypothetical protein n=1 Tax=Pseudonocardia sp. DSM 110487 TaxID=2865833 RepID=UPI001C6A3BE1|nr:hypothetical protein [Pseudonocardia sp. DSM 110487]QYN39022.1 hypothetical protein K1T35_18575 [Pseudonocardia sp. DSM 110487]